MNGWGRISVVRGRPHPARLVRGRSYWGGPSKPGRILSQGENQEGHSNSWGREGAWRADVELGNGTEATVVGT